MTLEQFLQSSWQGYSQITPDAPRIEELFRKRGEKFVNDHVAYRTFNIPGIRRHDLGAVFEQWGYKMADEVLDFPEKKLKANYWLHQNEELPKVFVSELEVEKVSPALQTWIRSYAEPAAKRIGKFKAEHLLEANWEPVKAEDYERFYNESEYASWTAAFGIRLNHFTVLVNSLKTFASLQEVNDFLRQNGFTLNESGGVIKGTPKKLLEQSSTMARKVEWTFANDVRKSALGCYYEFARRYPMPGTNQLFSGFISKSADKIFESTFEKKR